jgi:hypothetical protein
MQLIKVLKIYLNVNTMFIIHYDNTFRVYHYFIAYKKKKFIDDSPLCFTFHKLGNTWVPKKIWQFKVTSSPFDEDVSFRVLPIP